MRFATGVKVNTSYILLSNLIRLLSNVLLFMGIARLYGPSQFGQFTAAHTLSTIFILVADFGFDVLLSSEIARHRERAANLGHTYLRIKVVLIFLAVVAMISTVSFSTISNDTKLLMYVFVGYVAFSALLNFYFALFKGLEQMHHETFISMCMNAVLLVVIVILGIFRAPLVLLAISFVASRVIGLSLAMMRGRKLISLGKLISASRDKPDLIYVLVFGLNGLFANLSLVQDTILLSWWADDRQVGIYQSVIKIVSLGLIMLDVSFASLLPVLSRLHGNDTHQWQYVGRLLNKSLLFTALPIALLMIVFAEQIIEVVYGLGNYNEAVAPLRLFGIIVLIRYASDASGLILTSSQRQPIRLAVVAVAVVVNFLLNMYAIPRYGINGAAVVAIITNTIIAVGFVTFAWDIVKTWLFELSIYIPVVVGCMVGLVLWSYKALAIWFAIPIVIVTLGCAAYFFGFKRSEREFLFSFKRIA